MVKISASVMCADICRLEEDIRELKEAKVDYLHFDIMDGHFVPNFGFSLFAMESIKRVTSLPFDTHLMIEEPDRYIQRFAGAGSEIITVHAESTPHLPGTVQLLKNCGLKAGIALNPDTPLGVLEPILDNIDIVLIMAVNPGAVGQKYIPGIIPKIEELKEMIGLRKLGIDIEVDGNINPETVPLFVKAGANILVGGSSGLFGQGKTLREAVKCLREGAFIQGPED